MRRVRIALFALAVGACGKGGGGGAPSASSGSVVATAAPAPADDILKSVAVTELSAGMHVDNIPDGPPVVITDKAIVVDGRAMVAVTGGAIDPVDLEGGAKGIVISRLKAWAEAWRKLPQAKDATVVIAAKTDVPSKLLLTVVASFSAAGQRDFAFLVRTPDGPGAVPVHLPDAAAVSVDGPGAAPMVNPDDQPIQMVLSVTPKQALLWSMSGLEGTLSAPKLSLTPAAGGAWLSTVRDTLADIVSRRWGGGRPRPEAQKTIVVMADTSLAAGDLVAAVATVRHDAKGQPLYPDVLLSMGFEATAVATDKKPGAAPPKRDDSAALQEEAARYAAALVAEMDDSSYAGDMSRTRPGSDLGAQIDAIREQDQRVAVGGGSRGDRTPMTGTARGPRIDGPGGSAETTDTASQTPSGRVAIGGSSATDDTSLTTNDVLRKIQSVYMAGLKRCYKNSLKTDPSMRGKVTISFTVNESGRAVSGDASGFDGELDRCMEGLVASWTFPRPKDVDGEATEASFRITLTLTPD